LVLLFLIVPILMMAQSDRGTITGTVADPAGAMVPEAAITMKHVETGAIYETKTTGTGNYTLPSLPSGNYELTVTAAGFSKYVQQGIGVQVATTARVDVILKIGSAAETVTVTENVPLLKTESAEQSFNITTDQVNALPLTQGGVGLRNPLAFAQLTPSMSIPVTNTYGNIQARVNGLPDNTFRTLVDGQDITNGIDPSHLSESHPSTEALQEVQLSSSNFAAEFGRVAGGLFNLTSKSGSNQFHGSGYEYFTNEDLGAGVPFTSSGNGHLLRPNNRNNNFGFSVGGPVYIPHLYNGKNKTFFFFNLEEWRSSTVVAGSSSTVPSAAYRAGDFSAALTGRTLSGTDPLGRAVVENGIYDPLTERIVNGSAVRDQFPGNIIPASRLDPSALKVQALIPAATTSALVNNFAIVDPMTDVKTIPSIKVDQYFGAATKVSFYWSEWRQDQNKCCTADGLPAPISQGRNIIDRTPTYRVNIDRTVTPTLLVHLGAGVVHYWHVDSAPDGTLNYDAVGKLGISGASKTPGGFPNISGLLGASQGGMASNIGASNGSLYHNDKPTTVLSATWVKGNHTYKTGGEWQEDIWTSESKAGAVGTWVFAANQTAQPYLQTTSVGGLSDGFPYASFLLGGTNSDSISNYQDAQWRKHNLGFFVQDTWKVTRKLTLDYGIRWDYQTTYHEIYNRDSRFTPNTANPSAGGLLGATEYEGTGPGRCNCQFTSPYMYAIGPRLGVAYQLAPKTVLRAGWGLVYTTTPSANYQLGGAIGTGFNSIPFSNSAFGGAAAYLSKGLQYNMSDLYVASLDPGIRPLAGQISAPPVYENPAGGRPGRIMQWNVSLQREISTDLVVEAAYVGNRGVWLQADALQQFNNVTAARLASFGLDINSAADRSLLTSTMSSAQVIARGFKAPYASFPMSQTLAQALRPYPQFAAVSGRWVPEGNSWYDSLQAKVTKRYSHGLSATLALTWQKELTLDAQGGLGSSMEPEPVNDINNRYQNKYISKNSQPFQSTLGFNYRVPAMAGNRYLSAALRDWTVGGVLHYASGLPIQVPTAQNNLTSILQRGTFANRVPGQPLFLKDLNCHCIDPSKDLVLNPAAWSDPAAGQWGTSAAFYNDYRYARRPGESASIGRVFKIRESMSLTIRGEFFNVFNRTEINNPVSTNALASKTTNASGVLTGGFGFVNPGSVYANPRSGQILVRRLLM
jgi:hypothetical protein